MYDPRWDSPWGDAMRSLIDKARDHHDVEESEPVTQIEFMATMAETKFVEETLGYRPAWLKRYVDDLILPEDLDV